MNLVAYVRSYEFSLGVSGAEIPDQLLSRFVVSTGDNDTHACKGQSGGASDACKCTVDQNNVGIHSEFLAVEGLTRSAALEAAEFGVRVNVVAPGPIDTALLTRFTGTAERKAGLVAGVPLQHMGRPAETAQMIVFLASDKASFSTSATFAADGGKTAR